MIHVLSGDYLVITLMV